MSNPGETVVSPHPELNQVQLYKLARKGTFFYRPWALRGFALCQQNGILGYFTNPSTMRGFVDLKTVSGSTPTVIAYSADQITRQYSQGLPKDSFYPFVLIASNGEIVYLLATQQKIRDECIRVLLSTPFAKPYHQDLPEIFGNKKINGIQYILPLPDSFIAVAKPSAVSSPSVPAPLPIPVSVPAAVESKSEPEPVPAPVSNPMVSPHPDLPPHPELDAKTSESLMEKPAADVKNDVVNEPQHFAPTPTATNVQVVPLSTTDTLIERETNISDGNTIDDEIARALAMDSTITPMSATSSIMDHSEVVSEMLHDSIDETSDKFHRGQRNDVASSDDESTKQRIAAITAMVEGADTMSADSEDNSTLSSPIPVPTMVEREIVQSTSPAVASEPDPETSVEVDKKGVKERRVLMCSLDNAGKTTLLYALKLQSIIQTIPTVGFNVETISFGDNYELAIWDVGGGERVRSLWRHYLQATDVILYPVDATDPDRFEEASKELSKILGCIATDGGGAVPAVLVLANKQDLPNAINANDLRSALQLSMLQEETGCVVDCLPCSSTDKNAQQMVLQWIVDHALSSYQVMLCSIDGSSSVGGIAAYPGSDCVMEDIVNGHRLVLWEQDMNLFDAANTSTVTDIPIDMKQLWSIWNGHRTLIFGVDASFAKNRLLEAKDGLSKIVNDILLKRASDYDGQKEHPFRILVMVHRSKGIEGLSDASMRQLLEIDELLKVCEYFTNLRTRIRTDFESPMNCITCIDLLSGVDGEDDGNGNDLHSLMMEWLLNPFPPIEVIVEEEEEEEEEKEPTPEPKPSRILIGAPLNYPDVGKVTLLKSLAYCKKHEDASIQYNTSETLSFSNNYDIILRQEAEVKEQSVWRILLEKINVLVYLVDATDAASLDGSATELSTLLLYYREHSVETAEAPALLIVTLNNDMPDALNKDQVCEALNLSTLQEESGFWCEVLSCSSSWNDQNKRLARIWMTNRSLSCYEVILASVGPTSIGEVVAGSGIDDVVENIRHGHRVTVEDAPSEVTIENVHAEASEPVLVNEEDIPVAGEVNHLDEESLDCDSLFDSSYQVILASVNGSTSIGEILAGPGSDVVVEHIRHGHRVNLWKQNVTMLEPSLSVVKSPSATVTMISENNSKKVWSMWTGHRVLVFDLHGPVDELNVAKARLTKIIKDVLLTRKGESPVRVLVMLRGAGDKEQVSITLNIADLKALITDGCSVSCIEVISSTECSEGQSLDDLMLEWILSPFPRQETKELPSNTAIVDPLSGTNDVIEKTEDDVPAPTNEADVKSIESNQGNEELTDNDILIDRSCQVILASVNGPTSIGEVIACPGCDGVVESVYHGHRIVVWRQCLSLLEPSLSVVQPNTSTGKMIVESNSRKVWSMWTGHRVLVYTVDISQSSDLKVAKATLAKIVKDILLTRKGEHESSVRVLVRLNGEQIDKKQVAVELNIAGLQAFVTEGSKVESIDMIASSDRKEGQSIDDFMFEWFVSPYPPRPTEDRKDGSMDASTDVAVEDLTASPFAPLFFVDDTDVETTLREDAAQLIASRKRHRHVLVCSLPGSNAGQTSMVYAMKFGKILSPLPDTQASLAKARECNEVSIGYGDDYVITFYDVKSTVIGGEDSKERSWSKYLEVRHFDAVIYAVDGSIDSTNRLEASMIELREVVGKLLKQKVEQINETDPCPGLDKVYSIPVVVMVTKQDKRGALTTEDLKSIWKYSDWKSSRDVSISEFIDWSSWNYCQEKLTTSSIENPFGNWLKGREWYFDVSLISVNGEMPKDAYAKDYPSEALYGKQRIVICDGNSANIAEWMERSDGSRCFIIRTSFSSHRRGSLKRLEEVVNDCQQLLIQAVPYRLDDPETVLDAEVKNKKRADRILLMIDSPPIADTPSSVEYWRNWINSQDVSYDASKVETIHKAITDDPMKYFKAMQYWTVSPFIDASIDPATLEMERVPYKPEVIEKREGSFLICSLDNAGKTVLLYSLTKDKDVRGQTMPTMGYNAEILFRQRPGKTCKIEYSMMMWDIGGQRNIRPLWRHYVTSNTRGVIYPVDASDPARFQEAREGFIQLMDMFKTKREEEGLTGLGEMSVLVIANKQDVEGAVSAETLWESMSLDALRQEVGLEEGKLSVLPGQAMHEDYNKSIVEWVLDKSVLQKK